MMTPTCWLRHSDTAWAKATFPTTSCAMPPTSWQLRQRRHVTPTVRREHGLLLVEPVEGGWQTRTRRWPTSIGRFVAGWMLIMAGDGHDVGPRRRRSSGASAAITAAVGIAAVSMAVAGVVGDKTLVQSVMIAVLGGGAALVVALTMAR